MSGSSCLGCTATHHELQSMNQHKAEWASVRSITQARARLRRGRRLQGQADRSGWHSLPDKHAGEYSVAAWVDVLKLASLCNVPTCLYQIRAPFVSASVPASLMALYSLSPLLLWAELGCRFNIPPITDLSMSTGALIMLLLLLLLPSPLRCFGATVCYSRCAP